MNNQDIHIYSVHTHHILSNLSRSPVWAVYKAYVRRIITDSPQNSQKKAQNLPFWTLPFHPNTPPANTQSSSARKWTTDHHPSSTVASLTLATTLCNTSTWPEFLSFPILGIFVQTSYINFCVFQGKVVTRAPDPCLLHQLPGFVLRHQWPLHLAGWEKGSHQCPNWRKWNLQQKKYPIKK